MIPILIPAKVFPDADLDGNGHLTLDELSSYHESNPDVFDLELTETG